MSEADVRGYVRAGFLAPERGPRKEMRFSFQDLVFLRTAGGLAEAGVKPRRIRRALSSLRGRMPDGRPMTAVRIAVDGDRIVVEEGDRRWQPESGQILFDFGGADLAPEAVPIVRRAFPDAPRDGADFSADDWYQWGCELERDAPDEAIEAYRRALALDASHADAHVNLGRLLHESGDPAGAAPHYEAALAARADDGTAAYNLGVAFEDLGQLPEALLAYEKATRLEPENADAHFNAATLAEKLGRSAEALRHLREYRKLTRR